MKILILSKSPWDNTNSLGNTLSNFFSGVKPENISHIYFRSSEPNNDVCKTYFSLSDIEVAKTIFTRKHARGKGFDFISNEINDFSEKEGLVNDDEKLYSFFRQRQKNVIYELQELIWEYGKWKSPDLINYLNSFKPDIIFSPSSSSRYLHKILWEIQDITNAKVILFHADDYLSNNHKGLVDSSRKKKLKKIIKQSINKADKNYCISEELREEYEMKSGKNMNLLFKGARFEAIREYKVPKGDTVIQIIYIGSLLYGRWKSLALLAQEIAKINRNKKKYELNIYSQYAPSNEILKNIEIRDSSSYKGKLSAHEVADAYLSSDIVLHVESFDINEREKTRLSFSTKIVDLLKSGRTILALGWERAASIRYLDVNEAAITINDSSDICHKLKQIDENRDLLKTYARKSWQCGMKNHDLDTIQDKLIQDFKNLI